MSFPQQPYGQGWGTPPGGPPTPAGPYHAAPSQGLELVPIVVPPEPPPPPRKVPWSAGGWNANFMLVFGAGFGGIPTVIFAVLLATMGGPWDDWILDSRGVRVEAEPYAIEGTSTTINDRPLMRVKVRFEDRKGKTRKTSVTTLSPPAADSEATVDIDYDPDNVKRARIHGTSASPLGPMIFMPLMFGGIGIPLFFYGLITALRRRGIYRKGLAAQARVVDVTASASSQNRQRVMIAHYQYQSPRGVHHGELKTVSPPPRNSIVWVLYDPERPERSVAA